MALRPSKNGLRKGVRKKHENSMNYHASGNPNLREKIQTEKFGARPRTIQKASSRAINAEGGQREPSPGPYRRAEAEELYKTGARGGCSRRCGRGCSRRMEQRSGRREGGGEGAEG